jgi:hypothetical protein
MKENPVQYGEYIVDDYIDFYEGNAGWNVTMSVVDLSKIKDIAANLRDVTDYSLNNMNSVINAYIYAYKNATIYDENANTDFYHTFSLVYEKTTDENLKFKVENLLSSINQAVVESKVTTTNPVNPANDALDVSKSFGISFFFYKVLDSLYSYNSLGFVTKSGWNYFLKEFFKFDSGDNYISETFSPVIIKVLRQREDGASEVGESDFLYGYYALVGKYEYPPYENDEYEIYFKFDFSKLTDVLDPDKVEIVDSEIRFTAEKNTYVTQNVIAEV